MTTVPAIPFASVTISVRIFALFLPIAVQSPTRSAKRALHTARRWGMF